MADAAGSSSQHKPRAHVEGNSESRPKLAPLAASAWGLSSHSRKQRIAPGQPQGLTVPLLAALTQSHTDRHRPQGAAGAAGNSAGATAKTPPPPAMGGDWGRRLPSLHISSHWGAHVWRHQNMKKASQLGSRNTEDFLLGVCVEFFSLFYNECELLLISES